jgi:hypothetical protein
MAKSIMQTHGIFQYLSKLPINENQWYTISDYVCCEIALAKTKKGFGKTRYVKIKIGTALDPTNRHNN